MEIYEKNAEVPDPEHDYHGHPPYGRVILWLLGLFVLSLAVGYFISPLVAVVIVFLLAVLKTALVIGNFLHLKYEPLLIWIAVAAVAFCLLAFFWGVFPDISIIEPDVAK